MAIVERGIRFVGCSRDAAFSCNPVFSQALSSLDHSQYAVFPGFCDVHVHFREPGFSYKETISTGSMAAAAGGYTDVCTMPNLNPVPDCADHLQLQRQLIREQSMIHVYPYGAITVGQMGETLADMAQMAPYVIGFSDDGRGVQDPERMRLAMETAASLGKMIVAHCEDNSLLRGGYIHDGVYARSHGHAGICSESEFKQVERDLELVAQTGCAYHVCHISTRESVELIRQAKKSGLDVSCETAPHYLVLDENDLQEDGRFKMNPPLRAREDRQALLEGVLDGTIDMIATDHAPHAPTEKSKGLSGSAFGIVGLETAFPVLYTRLVKKELMPLTKLVELMSQNPRKRFHIPQDNRFCVWDLGKQWTVEPEKFQSMGKATPFAGWQLQGMCIMTVCDGRIVYQKGV